MNPPRPSRSVQRDHRAWLAEVDACLALASEEDLCARREPEVSGWSVAEQLEHLLLADRRILQSIDRVLATDPGEAVPGRPSLIGYVLLSVGRIPRGRGKAPEATRPTGMTAAELAEGFAEIRDGVTALGPRLAELEQVTHTSEHPLLGRFTPRRWVRFSGIHHRHHRRIVEDILSA